MSFDNKMNVFKSGFECGYGQGYQQGRADAIEEFIPKAFEWLMQMDIIDCDGCDYKGECVNRNMNCYDLMAEKFLEQMKEADE